MSVLPDRDPLHVWHPYGAAALIAELDVRVHVWRLRLDALGGEVAANLSEDERARAGRLVRPLDRQRFAAGRSVLRRILADCLELGDAEGGRALRLRCGPSGKPFLDDDPQLRFNVSHSEDLAVIAVTRSGEVGIDIERQRPLADLEGIARRSFTDAEQAAMLGCPPEARQAVFYRIWTRKEALLKALGIGLPSLGDPKAIDLGSAAAAWLVTTLPHLDGYAASLARPRGAHGLKLWSWSNTIGMREVERRTRPRPAPPQPPLSNLRFEVCR